MDAGQPLRLLYVAAIDGFAGAERQLYYLARSMHERGAAVTCAFVSGSDQKMRPFVDAGLQCRLYAGPPRRQLIRLRWLRDMVRQTRPDIVHTYLYVPGLLGRVAARAAGVRRIVVSERSGPAAFSTAYRALDRLLSVWTTAVIANSEAGRRFHVELRGMRPDRVATIPNGIEGERFADACLAAASAGLAEKIGVRRGSGVVGMIANFSHWKNHRMLVDAIVLLKERGVPCRLVLAGEGPLASDIRRHVQQCGLEADVHFVGAVRDPREVLGLIDIFVLASRVEGMSNAVLEACAAAVPCVVTDVGGNAEVVENGVNGFVVPPDDSSAMADRIADLLADPDAARAMGARGRERALRHHSVTAMADAHMQQYLRLMKA